MPDAPARYGPLAGRALAGAEGQGPLYGFLPDGSYETWSLGVNVEDIEIITPRENFFGVNLGTSKLLGASASQLDGLWGDLMLTQEYPAGNGLYRLRFEGTDLVVDEFGLNPGGPAVGQWEHVTFANADIREVPQGG